MLKNAETNAELKVLDVDFLVTEHLQENKTPKVQQRTWKAQGRINPQELSLPHWGGPPWKRVAGPTPEEEAAQKKKIFQKTQKKQKLSPGSKISIK